MDNVYYFLKQKGMLRQYPNASTNHDAVNFSRESISERTLSAVSPKSTKQVCTSYPKSLSLSIASCAAACTRLASHPPVVFARLESINLGQCLDRGLFSLTCFPIALTTIYCLWQSHSSLQPYTLDYCRLTGVVVY